MRFGGFSVKNTGLTGLGSGTLNKSGTGSDGLYGMNAYEAGIMVFLVEQWKAYGPARTYKFQDVDDFLRQQKNYDAVLGQIAKYQVGLLAEWKEEYKPRD